jgi:hypothetical protein
MESHQGPPLLPPEVQAAVRESVREELSRIFQAREAREIESGLVFPLPPGEDNSLAPGVGLIVPWEEFDRRLCKMLHHDLSELINADIFKVTHLGSKLFNEDKDIMM